MTNILLFGAPGAGKGTMSKLIAEKLGMQHLSTGDIIRKEIADKTEVGLLAEKMMVGGNLASDELVIRMVKETILKSENKVGFIFDGFPRTIAQAKSLDVFLFKRKTPIKFLFNLKVEDELVIKRIIARGPRVGESADDVKKEAVRRLAIYKKETFPLLEYFSNRSKTVDIDGAQEIDKEFEEILKHLK
jgi:adenylate kinase